MDLRSKRIEFATTHVQCHTKRGRQNRTCNASYTDFRNQNDKTRWKSCAHLWRGIETDDVSTSLLLQDNATFGPLDLAALHVH